MTTLKERIEANADLVLWCVHVLGPNDVHATPNHEAAVVQARELNKALFRKASPAHDVPCFAYAAPWPHSKEAHEDAIRATGGGQ